MISARLVFDMDVEVFFNTAFIKLQNYANFPSKAPYRHYFFWQTNERLSKEAPGRCWPENSTLVVSVLKNAEECIAHARPRFLMEQ